MQIGEEELAWPEQPVFGGKRFLHLHDQLPLAKDLFVGGNDPGTSADILGIGITSSRPGSGSDEHFVSGSDELGGTGWEQPDPMLLGLYLLRGGDDHPLVEHQVRADARGEGDGPGWTSWTEWNGCLTAPYRPSRASMPS